jgi:16S rRNA (uracil1498-N3)-methyltransferase
MRFHRFFIEGEITLNNALTLSDEELIHQWKKVFRFSTGDRVILFNNTGNEYVSRIELLTKDEARVLILEETKTEEVLKTELTVYMSILKKDNMEWVLQKGTELGVSHFVPIITDRTEKKDVHGERALKIIKEAAEQSGRTILPTLHETQTLEEALSGSGETLLVFHMTGQRFSEGLRKGKMGIVIGPEGGWTDRELELFKSRSIPVCNLGSFVLRAETAAVAATTLVMLS